MGLDGEELFLLLLCIAVSEPVLIQPNFLKPLPCHTCVFVCVCVSVCVCVYVYVCYASECAFLRVCNMRACTWMLTYAGMQTMNVCVCLLHIFVCMCISNVCMCIHVCATICTCVCACVYVCGCLLVCVGMCVCL